MNRTEAKTYASELQQQVNIIQAYAEGKTIQTRSKAQKEDWSDCGEPVFGYFDSTEYRVKPEPREYWIIESPDDRKVVSYRLSSSKGCEVIHVREVI